MVGMSQSGSSYEPHGGMGKEPLFVLQDRYEVIDHLGQGGMGTVYVARDRRLGRRQCVVKKLRDDFFREEDKERAMAFFEREVLVLSNLQHANIVHIHDSFKEDGDCFLVMEYVEGENLHQMLNRRGEPFPEEQVLQWASQICEVLDYLHTNEPQIIYRDLKPSNIMIDTKDRVKLVDFGIARPYIEDTDNTHVVSAGYSPPEQYWGSADARSDIYALGATMHFLLTGEEPLALQVSSPKSLNEDITEHTDRVVKRATSQDLLLRYQSAVEMREDLDQWKEAKKAGKSKATRAVLVALVAFAVIVVAATGYSLVANLNGQAADKAVARYRKMYQNLQSEERDLQRENDSMKKKRLAQDAQTEQANPVDVVKAPVTPIPVEPLPTPAQPAAQARTKPATVAFREVDEAALTDPEGLAPPEDDVQQSSSVFPFMNSNNNTPSQDQN
jgi:serine/threonine protein kinase